MRTRLLFANCAVLMLACGGTRPAPDLVGGADVELVVLGGTVVDGSGAGGVLADVGVRDGRIVFVGNAGAAGLRARDTIDARHLIVAPGFIDLHVHVERLLSLPAADNYVRQGVTTVLGNPDGGWLPHRPSPWPLAQYMDSVAATPLALNVAFLVGHNTVRREVLGMAARAPSPTELEQMRALVAAGMGAGAFGISTGLNYAPGTYATTSEVVALAKVAADSGGIYTTHLRDEGLRLLEALREAVAIAKATNIPVVIDHHKAFGTRAWGMSNQSLALIDSARAADMDVTLNQYPYTAAATTVASMIPSWALAGGDSAFLRRLDVPTLRDSVARGVAAYLSDFAGGDLRRVQFARVGWMRALEGRTLDDWAREQGMQATPINGAHLVIDAVRRGGATAIFHFMDDSDVERIMRHPLTMIASDGELTFPGDAHLHPRSYGTFPRVLGYYVRERQLLALEDAIRRMTSMPAGRLGLIDRGRIIQGARADVVVFDAAIVSDRATFEQPHQYPVGIKHVVVNGVVTVRDGIPTGARGGQVLRRGASRSSGRYP